MTEEFAESAKGDTWTSAASACQSALMTAARNKVAECEAEVAKARKSRDEEVAYCSAHKMQVGKDYWKRVYRAEEQLRCAKAFLEALIDVQAEG